ncbi:hypothetical protein LWF15_12295 [Kineosporia rhizophila]|uniref:hypothetical protein n=1 Tax=Kineosporia TaxID=49184 RepID=UPI000B1F6625|nr:MULTISPECIES: hypothetical protein [Kineosporia]MCE0536289.1 hypothetical protein [Kineosporia rhizophila]GLY15125.1 hypothetical protein Kisp01_21400 [Kineosporia sp. NBRC 101677]
MTTVVLDHTDEWVQADLEADPRRWAQTTILRRAARERAELSAERVGLLVDVMVPALEAARKEEIPPVMLLFLQPVAAEPVICSVVVRVEAVPESLPTAGLLEEFRLPEEMLEQPAVQETIQTPAGPAVHLVQRYRAPVNPEYELVQEHEVFVWRVSDSQGDLAFYLSTGYLDLVEAARCRPKLVELASTLTVTSDPVS